MKRYEGNSPRKYSLRHIEVIRDKIEASIPEQRGIDLYVYTPEQWAEVEEQRAINAANISHLIEHMQEHNEHSVTAKVSWPEYVVEELEHGVKNEWIEGEWHCDRETFKLSRDKGRTLLYIPDMHDIPCSIVDLLSKEFVETKPHYYAAPYSRKLVSSIRAELSH